MPEPATGTSKENKLMHYSVGAIIESDDGKILLMERKNPPYGLAGPAGHVDEGETPDEALLREVREETNLQVKEHKLLLEEEINNNVCVMNVKVHYWYLFKCYVEGEIKKEEKEAKSLDFYNMEEPKCEELEPVWKYFLEKLEKL